MLSSSNPPHPNESNDSGNRNKEEIRKMKLKKQEKKMTKVLSKAWSLDGADLFQEAVAVSADSNANASNSSTAGIRLDLSTVGQHLDNGEYSLGRKGWEAFAAELGYVYNQFIVQK
jgi:hypothetical protein